MAHIFFVKQESFDAWLLLKTKGKSPVNWDEISIDFSTALDIFIPITIGYHESLVEQVLQHMEEADLYSMNMVNLSAKVQFRCNI